MKTISATIDQIVTMRQLAATAPASGLTVEGVNRLNEVLQIVQAPLQDAVNLTFEDAQYQVLKDRVAQQRWQSSSDDVKAFLALFD